MSVSSIHMIGENCQLQHECVDERFSEINQNNDNETYLFYSNHDGIMHDVNRHP